MTRDIVIIDEEKCNGCGVCIPECHEGALQIIEGKARLVSDLFCDGLGACIRHCPEGALHIEEREAQPYDERKVMEIMVTKGKNTVLAHLRHLKDHGEVEFLRQAVEYLEENGIHLDLSEFKPNESSVKEIVNELFGAGATSALPHSGPLGGCPGSQSRQFIIDQNEVDQAGNNAHPIVQSQLRQWPVQLHLLNPQASYFRNADVVLTADCVAYTMGDFHNKYLRGRSLAIACPKLDSNLESYVDKLKSMIHDAQINSLTILRMEVPCCGGLVQLARAALNHAGRKIPVKEIVIGIQGEVLTENWI